MVSVLVLVVMLGVVAAAYQLGRHPGHAAGSRGHPSRPVTSPVTVLTPVSAHGFDAYNLGDSGDENSQYASLAIDGNPGTAWYTQYYFHSSGPNSTFGGLKPGTGLILDMGQVVRLSSVQILFGPIPGADVQVKIGNTDQRSPATVSALTTVATATDVGGARTFAAAGNASGRYVLIWFTKLPRMAGARLRYMAEIFNVVLRGSDVASQ